MATPARSLATPLAPSNQVGATASLFRDTYTLYRRAIMRMIRFPIALYFSLLQPLIWFVLFGQLFSRLTTGFAPGGATASAQNPITAQFGTTNYQSFLLASVIIQMMIFGSTGAALGIITDDQNGYLNKLRVAPINRMAILLGGMLAELSRMLLQVLILIIVGVVLGVRINHLELLPMIFILSALFGLMMGGLGLYIGLTTRNTQTTFLIANFFNLPLLFTSSAQLPIALLPDWLQVVAHVNPATYAIESMRVIIIGLNNTQLADGQTVWSVIGLGLVVLVALTVVTIGLATYQFRKQIK